jgi:hypothetical protein
MANETLVSMPTKFEDFRQVRAFAVKLVEQLDIVLGYRGTVGYEQAGTASTLTKTTLASLTETADEFSQVLDEFREELVAITESIEQYKTGLSIADTSYTAPTISVLYVPAEVQGIADSLESVSDKLDSLLAALRGVEILS